MKKWGALFFVLGGLLFSTFAHAQYVEAPPVPYLGDTPAGSCPGRTGGYASELSWTINCFLQAVLDKNKDVIAQLSTFARCLEKHPCDGVLNMDTSQFIFGPQLPYYKNTLYDLISKAKSITITFDPRNDSVAVFFFPRPGKAKDTLSNGWMKSFFACFFFYDKQQGIWMMSDLCADETDVFTGSEDESAKYLETTTIDLNGGDSTFPIMIWKPRKK